jgi:acetyltransferase-like isoleucine patch superfamily enzyme
VNLWLDYGYFALAGAAVGIGCIDAVRSVVTRNLAADTIAAWVPTRSNNPKFPDFQSIDMRGKTVQRGLLSCPPN